MFRITLLLITGLLSFSSSAELYKWVDENGKVHFSDQKHRAAKNAQDISASLKSTNVDASQRSQKQLNDVFKQKQQAEQANQPSAKEKQAAYKARYNECRKMRYKLSKIDGRVQYVDKDGKIIPMTEKQRQQDVAQTQAWLNKNC